LEVKKITNNLQNPLEIKEIDEGKVHCFECEEFESCPGCGHGKCDIDNEWKDGDEWRSCPNFKLN
jgi:hypothetical protein